MLMKMVQKRKPTSFFVVLFLVISMFSMILSPRNNQVKDYKSYPQRETEALLPDVFISSGNPIMKRRSSTIKNLQNGKSLMEIPRLFRYEGNLGRLNVPYGPGDTKDSREWTFMVYLDADNNLEECGIYDFLEMASVGSTSDVAIVVLFDRTPGYTDSYGDWTDAKIFYVTNGMSPLPSNAEKSLGEVNMGSPQTLVDFVSYAMHNYPASHYALVLWDHGGGLSGVCWDDSGDNLNLYEIRNALDAIYSEFNIKIDVLGFDACLMGMMEIAYQLKDYVDYVVFSQEVEPGYGWPYDDILTELISNPSISPSELAITMARKYVESYNYGSQGYYSEATQSAINISNLELYVFRKFDRLLGELLRHYNDYASAIGRAADQAEAFYYSNQKDIIDFLIKLREEISNVTLNSMINDTISVINDSILYGGHLSGHPNAHGLSIYLQRGYLGDYEKILMSRHHQWDELLMKYSYLNLKCWFYDAEVFGYDKDSDGYLEYAFVLVDLDSDYNETFNVIIRGTDGQGEYFFGEKNVEVYGSTSDDIFKIPIRYVPTTNIYSLSLEIRKENRKIMELYYHFDDNTSSIPLEPPPYVEITDPTNNTYVQENNVVVKWKFNGSTTLINFEICLDNGDWINKGKNTSHVFSDLNEGIHSVSVRAYDNLGYIVNSTVIFGIDTEPPYLYLLSPDNNSVINNKSIILRWMGHDNVMVDHYSLCIDQQEWIDIGNVSMYSLYLDNGIHSIGLRIFDCAGNYREYRLVVVIDTDIPSIEIISPRDNYRVGTVLNVSWIAIDSTTGIDQVKVLCNGSILATFITNKNYTDSILIKNLQHNFNYIIEVVAYDRAGNNNSDCVKIKVVPLKLEIISPINGSTYNKSWIVIEWNCSRNTSQISIHLNGSIQWKNSSDISYANLTGINEGRWLIRITAEDEDINVSRLIVITVDLSEPVITIIRPKNNSLIISSTIKVEWNIIDLSNIKQVMIRIDHTSWINVSHTNTYSFKNVGNGKHIIEILAADSAGHTTTVRIIVNVNRDILIIFIDITLIITIVAIVAIDKIKRKKKQ